MVDESSVPLKTYSRREFSGRREFCPLVDESSVLKVDESSVFDGRREFMDPYHPPLFEDYAWTSG